MNNEEKLKKIKEVLKGGVAETTREKFDIDFEDFCIADIKDEMWELYERLYQIECILKGE